MDLNDLHRWCSIPAEELIDHPERRIPLRIVPDSTTMGRLMARELVDDIREAARAGRTLRAIIPCGPSSWYRPFADIVNTEHVSLSNLEVFHMDECLDWQGRELSTAHPYSFRGAMERDFYNPISAALAVPQENRYWLTPETMLEVERLLEERPADIALGGWGQDGHVAYNQARRHPFSATSIEQLRTSTVRIQDNNLDTIVTLGQRVLGAAYQFVPPMSVTLGMRQILGATTIRLFSDTGAWKQTALRVGLFSPLDAEYPLTLLQEHSDALLTATQETAEHPISRHTDWVLTDR